jgi:hypothetical protein
MTISKRLHLLFRNLKTSLFTFTKTATRITSHQQPKPHSFPSNIFHRISDTPLGVFIDCSVDKNYKSLIKYGHCKQDILQHAWEQIYQEYAEKTGTNTYKLLMNLSRDVGYLESKRYIIAICLKVLQHRPDQKCIKILKDYGYKLQFDISTPEKYIEDINQVANRTGALSVAIEQKRTEIINSTKKLNGREVTRDHFDMMIASISKYMGIRIDRDVVTVSEFISYRKLYEKEIEANIKQTEKEKIKGIRHKV